MPGRVAAQCLSGYTATNETHTASGSSDGATPSSVSLPQFHNPNGYTFISAEYTVLLTNFITITFTNTSTTSTAHFIPAMARQDYLEVNGSDVYDADISHNMPVTNLAVAPGPGNSKTYTNIPVYNGNQTVDYVVPSSDPSLVGTFEGPGNITLTYTPITIINNVLASVNYNSPPPDIADIFQYTLNYVYCAPVNLATGIVTFTAVRRNDQTVALNWTTTNEAGGRHYDIEVSEDGRNFSDYDSVPSDAVNSDATYSYHYPIPSGAGDRLYFRIKQVDINRSVSYSEIRFIELGGGGPSGFSIYPNPPIDFLNLSFPATSTGWQVDIVTADGSLVQRNYYPNTNQARLNFVHKMPPGIYFSQATDMKAGKRYTKSFVIQ